jgi:hypothetical protein
MLLLERQTIEPMPHGPVEQRDHGIVRDLMVRRAEQNQVWKPVQ